MAERRTRTTGLQSAFMTYVQQNAGRLLTIDELLSVKDGLTRGQVSSAMNNMINRELMPGLAAGKARGTWIFRPVAAAKPQGGFEPCLIEIVPAEGGGHIGIDRDNGRVWRMERMA